MVWGQDSISKPCPHRAHIVQRRSVKFQVLGIQWHSIQRRPWQMCALTLWQQLRGEEVHEGLFTFLFECQCC